MRDTLDHSFAAHGLDWPTVVRYLSGSATDGEVARVRSWLGDDRERWQELEFLRGIWNSPVHADAPSQNAFRGVEDALAQFRTREAEKNNVPKGIPAQSHRGLSMEIPGRFGVQRLRLGRRTLQRLVWAAGSVVLAIGMFFGFSQKPHSDLGTTRTYATRDDQQSIITLDDSTRVTLAPHSVLRLVDFSSTHRTVAVDGEAYFEVRHAAGAPFIVHTDNLQTRVLGTTFLVRHDVDQHRTHIAMVDGKVSVSGGHWQHGEQTLTAGVLGDMTDSTIQIGTADLETAHIARKNDEFVFRDTPVSQVLKTLTQWYGYQFRCADSTVTQQNVNMWISMRSSAAALVVLERVLSVNVSVTADTVTLIPHAVRATQSSPRVRTYDVWTPNREVGR